MFDSTLKTTTDPTTCTIHSRVVLFSLRNQRMQFPLHLPLQLNSCLHVDSDFIANKNFAHIKFIGTVYIDGRILSIQTYCKWKRIVL